MTERNFWSRKAKLKEIVLRIEENDFSVLEKLLEGGDKTLLEYVENFSLFRMFALGLRNKNLESYKKLEKTIDELNQSGSGQQMVLPLSFETARKIILKMKKEEDFKKILKKVRSEKK